MNLRTLLLGAAAVLTLSSVTAKPLSDLVPPQKRAASIEVATRLLKPRDPAALALPADLKNPFNPVNLDRPEHEEPKASAAAETVAETGQPARAATTRDILATIAPMITPSGTIMLGGEPILLFGQKKARVGDRLPVLFEGVHYDLTITAIERAQFTLRLNREEITRPIKSASKP